MMRQGVAEARRLLRAFTPVTLLPELPIRSE